MKRTLASIIATAALATSTACLSTMPPTGKVIDKPAQVEQQQAFAGNGYVEDIALTSYGFRNTGVPTVAYTILLHNGQCGRRVNHQHNSGETVTLEQVELESILLGIAKRAQHEVSFIGSQRYDRTGCIAIETITISGKEYSHTK